MPQLNFKGGMASSQRIFQSMMKQRSVISIIALLAYLSDKNFTGYKKWKKMMFMRENFLYLAV